LTPGGVKENWKVNGWQVPEDEVTPGIASAPLAETCPKKLNMPVGKLFSLPFGERHVVVPVPVLRIA
jgi:hypothetical protein